MEDVTEMVDRAATCLRDLWNRYFYVGSDEMSAYPHEIQDLFEDVEASLFGAFVLFNLDRLAFLANYRTEPLLFLKVTPATTGSRLFVNRPSDDGNRYFDAFSDSVGGNEVTLNFISWFDWNRYGKREFQYYLVSIAAFPNHPEFEGRGALVECKGTRVLFDDRTDSPDEAPA